MAVKGSWAAKQTGNVAYTGAARWGNGVNPVHGIRANNGRNIAPGVAQDVIDPEITDQYAASQYGYCDEDAPDIVFGYGTDTGLADRPSLGESSERVETQQRFPAWGNKRNGVPGGSRIRAEDHGAEANLRSRIPQRTAAPDFIGKETTYELDAEVSDVDQVYRQTSMQQLHRVRAGSQISGTASEYSAPVTSRVPPMRVMPRTGGYRHDEMTPREQRPIMRPFFRRKAGTGPTHYLESNSMYRSEPIQRVPPQDPNVGSETGSVFAGNDHGYVDEDMTW